MKRIICVLLAFLLLIPGLGCFAGEEVQTLLPFDADARSAVLMEAGSGRILYEKNGNEPLPPASVTKIMTLLLIMEALDSGKIGWNDPVQTSDHAASMGGSQIYLKAGEIMTVEQMLKSVVVSSANDAAVALAEYAAGSEESFVERMNARAAELGLENTHFENPTGLDDDVKNHVFSAISIAKCSRELIVNHPKILEYSSIWMDTIRDGAFGLSNTNRLIRFYSGANGLKTGSTSKAKFCISATALRDGMQLIAVVMGSETRDIRNETAKKLLDFGFANFERKEVEGGQTDPVKVFGGLQDQVGAEYGKTGFLIEKGTGDRIEKTVEYQQTLTAPIEKGEEIGKVTYTLDGKVIGTVPVTISEKIEKIGYAALLARLIRTFFLG